MNQKRIIFSILLLINMRSFSQNVAINNDATLPDNSSLLDVKSTSKGMLVPRMLQSERNLISNPATGLLIYQTDNTQGFYVNNGTPGSPVWSLVGPSLNGTSNYVVKFTGPNTGGNSLIYDNGTNVGIGTLIPSYPLHVNSATSGNTAYFSNSGGSNNAVYGINTAAAGTGIGSGIVGITSQSTGAAGLKGQNTSTTGTGVIGAGNNLTPVNLINGSGAAFTGLTTGVYSKSTSSGASQSIYSDNFGNIVALNYWNGSIQYKINGTGTVSTNVAGLNNEKVTLHAPETPEIYFQDYGQAQLLNGRAHINLDPVLAKNVLINDEHPLRVFVQLEGDCKGVFVTNKTPSGFDVVELNGGTSNTAFQWSITCNRADEDLGNGHVSRNAGARFEPAIKPEKIY